MKDETAKPHHEDKPPNTKSQNFVHIELGSNHEFSFAKGANV
jgi:hypothetical protein